MKFLMVYALVTGCCLAVIGGCATTQSVRHDQEISITVDDGGALMVQGHPTEVGELGDNLAKLGADNTSPVTITAAREAGYIHIAEVLDRLAALGYSRVSVITVER